jgi:VCBS repeat-containing protein
MSFADSDSEKRRWSAFADQVAAGTLRVNHLGRWYYTVIACVMDRAKRALLSSGAIAREIILEIGCRDPGGA